MNESVSPAVPAPDTSCCYRCRGKLTADAIGLNYKLIRRDATEFLCLDCLAREFGVTTERLREKIAEFKAAGCLLFP